MSNSRLRAEESPLLEPVLLSEDANVLLAGGWARGLAVRQGRGVRLGARVGVSEVARVPEFRVAVAELDPGDDPAAQLGPAGAAVSSSEVIP